MTEFSLISVIETLWNRFVCKWM